MRIRKATRDDEDAVRGVHLSAFPKGEGDLVSKLAADLLAEDTVPPILSLVSEFDGIVVGHVAFSPVTIRDTMELLGYILAPLAVSPEFQKRGIASRLVETGITRLSDLGSGILLVYGDPDFYSRFGFSVDAAESYTPPYQLHYSFGWQGMAFGAYEPKRAVVGISCVSSLRNQAFW